MRRHRHKLRLRRRPHLRHALCAVAPLRSKALFRTKPVPLSARRDRFSPIGVMSVTSLMTGPSRRCPLLRQC